MTGLAREAVTRTLYVLQNKGEITIGKNKMIYLRNSTSAEI
jgi:hypothetical protein